MLSCYLTSKQRRLHTETVPASRYNTGGAGCYCVFFSILGPHTSHMSRHHLRWPLRPPSITLAAIQCRHCPTSIFLRLLAADVLVRRLSDGQSHPFLKLTVRLGIDRSVTLTFWELILFLIFQRFCPVYNKFQSPLSRESSHHLDRFW